MTGRRHTALFTAVLTVLFTSLLSPSTALSQGNTAAEAATQLLKADLEGKRKALAAITQSSDARVGRFLQAYLGSEIYLWNDDVALRQKYRLWNLIPAGPVKPPVLSPPPNAEMEAVLTTLPLLALR